MKLVPALVAAPLLLAGGLSTASAAEEQLPGWAGSYAGSYVCSDGEHGFFLDVSQISKTSDAYSVSGILGFFPVLGGAGGSSASAAGSFLIAGTVNADGSWRLEPGEWLVEPENYGAAIMIGSFSQRPDGQWQIIGKPLVPGNEQACTDLIATQFLP